ncbi:hypothetical protein C8R44DRAFT_718466 [Mycena epipterygia]|nr:hypothetical protein C8R44DRAFT_718466 [Mycena epipterygia]
MATAAPPWDAWALDKKFLDDLDGWLKVHPDDKLGTVLDTVCKAIDSGKDLINLIPDSPFPARSLIQALGALVQLGNTVRKAKSAALKFAKEIVVWTENILKAFQQGDVGQFTTKTWNNLDSIRVLVDEICQWANDRLKDGWWSSLKNKLKVGKGEEEKGIQEFQSQLDKATSSFMQLSMINLSQAHDVLLKGNILLLKEVEKAYEEIQKAHKEIDKILDQIQDFGEYAREKRLEDQYRVDLAFIQEELAPYIAANSGYREQGKEFCYSGTRREPLAEIKNWLSREASHFLWLTGEPGAGKSTIAATVCRDLKDSNFLWAHLFINRNNKATTNPKFFFPSIALQLAKRSPEVAHVIYCALQEKSSIVDEVNKTLAEQLFLEPLKCASKAIPLQPIVVVVDALDEAKNFDILAEILSTMTTRLPANIKVFMSSREEDDIRASWATAQDTKHLSVGTGKKSSIEDVELFLQDQIREIATKHKLGEWPSKEDMQKLCLQASGLFIWATTAVTYIGSQIKLSGSECLDDVLDQLNVEGMSDINKLYHVILDNIYGDQTNPWLFETFRRVVGAIVVLSTPLSVGILAKILDLRRVDAKNPSKIYRPVDMLHFVRQFRTVLVTGTEEITQETIPRLHKSFFEFILSENVQSDLQVSVLLSHKEVAPKCLNYSANVGDVYFQAARSSYQWLVNNLPDNDQDLPAYLLCFGDLECSNYQHCGEVGSLDTSISVITRLIKLTLDDHHEKPQYLNKLCTLYHLRYQRQGEVEDLEYALQNMGTAVSLTPEGHPDQPGYLQSLAGSFRDRYKRLGDLMDLEMTLQTIQQAVDLTPDGHPDRPPCLQSLANVFRDRYTRLGYLGDLETALQTIQQAVALTPEGHPNRPGNLQSQGVCFKERYQRLGSLQDLETAVQFLQEAVDSTLEGHPDRPACLQSLADSFRYKYKRLGDLMDLETALQASQQAVVLTPQWHSDLPHFLCSQALSFNDRHQRLGDLQDLEAALQLLQQAVDLTPRGHPDQAGLLQSLSVSFRDRYYRLQNPYDLEVALQAIQEAVDLTPSDHPDRPGHLQSLATALRDRYQKSGDLQDHETALQLNQEAIDLTPEGHPNRPAYLQTLADSFRDRHKRLGNLIDLERALLFIQQAVDLTAEGNPALSAHLQTMAVSFGEMYERSGDLGDLETAFATFRKSFTASYSAAFDLLPEILWIGNSLVACQDARRRIDITEVTSAVIKACLDLPNPQLAVEFLERGLATTFQPLQQLKIKFDDLAYVVPHLANEFQHISREIYHGTSPDTKWLALKRNELLRKIREIPGFQYFLCPKPYSSLCQAAQNGPIVILNSHNARCDAIILLNPASDPLHVPLPGIALNELQHQRHNFRISIDGNIRLSGLRQSIVSPEESLQDVLTWLWTNVVVHIYEALELVSTYILKSFI